MHSVLLLAIFLSYLPQIVRIIRFGSIKGISVWFLTFGALYTNIQLAYTLLLCARAWPSDGPAEPVLVLIGDHSLQGIAAIGAVLGLVQVALQWVCTITMYVLPTIFQYFY
jgi:hypothetical protein